MTRENYYGDTDKLLFDILQELKKLNATNEPVKEENKQYPCKACGGVHDNKGQLLACAKKRKKEGVNDGL